jgi:hypothetical protein
MAPPVASKIYTIDTTFYHTLPAWASFLLALEAQAAPGLFQKMDQGEEVVWLS